MWTYVTVSSVVPSIHWSGSGLCVGVRLALTNQHGLRIRWSKFLNENQGLLLEVSE